MGGYTSRYVFIQPLSLSLSYYWKLKPFISLLLQQPKEKGVMGLSNFPSTADGVLPVLVINTVLSVAMFKNMVRSVLQVVGGGSNWEPEEQELQYPEVEIVIIGCDERRRRRRVSITQFKSLGMENKNNMKCCVCLCRFEDEEEVSELSCKHFFHKTCLEKWFHNNHTTCPLCRSIL